jgi:hypothetical protein
VFSLSICSRIINFWQDFINYDLFLFPATAPHFPARWNGSQYPKNAFLPRKPKFFKNRYNLEKIKPKIFLTYHTPKISSFNSENATFSNFTYFVIFLTVSLCAIIPYYFALLSHVFDSSFPCFSHYLLLFLSLYMTIYYLFSAHYKIVLIRRKFNLCHAFSLTTYTVLYMYVFLFSIAVRGFLTLYCVVILFSVPETTFPGKRGSVVTPQPLHKLYNTL